jgi:cytochrome b6-f complex iron-sulfur subunit
MKTSTPEVRIGRRRLIGCLLSFAAVSTLVGVLTPIIGFLWPPLQAGSSQGGRMLAGEVNDFPVNSGTVVPYNGEPVIIVNSEVGGLKAFSAICTHLACITYWHEDRQVIQCPCHDGRFNPLNGSVIFGPPPRPLPPYEVEIVAEQVFLGEAKGPIGPI